MRARPVRSLAAGLVVGLPIALVLAELTGAPGTPLVVVAYYGIYLPVLALVAAPWLFAAAAMVAWLGNATCRSVAGRQG